MMNRSSSFRSSTGTSMNLKSNWIPRKTPLIWQIIQSIVAVASLIWLIVVIKVFIIQDRNSYLSLLSTVENAEQNVQQVNVVLHSVDTTSNLKDEEANTVKKFTPKVTASTNLRNQNLNGVNVISSDGWKFERSRKNYLISGSQKIKLSSNLDESSKSESNEEDDDIQMANVPGKVASELTWPPVDENGNIPEEDGYDFMKLTNLKVPRFWEAPEGQDINTIGSKINEEETIFLMIASYRDFQCHETIAIAFARADHPERLFVGAVDQVVPGDVGCFYVETPCSENPDQTLCKYRNQIAVFSMDAQYATGPVTARHIGDRMYRGQYFVMQMDAHCLFINHWDTNLISQWKQTGNEMAVLSSYLTDVQESVDSNGDSLRNTRPIMCNSDFEGEMPARYLRHLSQPESFAVIRDMPQLEPFWAAGFSFSRGHFKYRVPYDGYQPMVFQGEEIAIGIRGFTFGYDFYAFRDSVVFHEYAVKSSRRNKVHMFWENSQKHQGEAKKSIRRATAIIGMAPDLDPASWDHTEEQRYGLGNVRSLSLFYKLFLIDPKNRVATRLCPFVETGIMHREFQPHLRSDGLGIDYSDLENFDTTKYVVEQ